MTLYIRTDTATATIGLYATGHSEKEVQIELGRAMAKDLPAQIEKLVEDWQILSGIVVFEGPGSFTGLRIGITIANTLGYALSIPVVGAQGENWLSDGVDALAAGGNDRIVLPHYGAEAHITQPRK